MREDTQSKRIDGDAPASKRLGDGKHPHYLHLAGLDQVDGLDEEASPTSGDWLLLEDPTTGIVKKTAVCLGEFHIPMMDIGTVVSF